MKYIEQYNLLKAIFNLDRDEIILPGGMVVIKKMDFKSSLNVPVSEASADKCISQNLHFRYPVLLPANKKKADKVIILLHGLNERSWHKHLAGAQFLCENSETAVLLFPLSFHMNRGLPEWTDTRKMADPLEKRKMDFPDIKDSSIINLALSARLTEFPERFFISGFQSTVDLAMLIEDIRNGTHPLFEKNTRVDLFAYSVSCMLLQSLIIHNPGSILNKSKIIMFAGGSLFSQINGVSKYIMDSIAYSAIRNFYLKLTDKESGCEKNVRSWILDHNFGRSFLSLIKPEFMKKERNKAFENFYDNMMVLALQNDRIMPVEGIRNAMGENFCQSSRFRVLHFPYNYTHENPFPVLYEKLAEKVDMAFHTVYSNSLEFLNN